MQTGLSLADMEGKLLGGSPPPDRAMTKLVQNISVLRRFRCVHTVNDLTHFLVMPHAAKRLVTARITTSALQELTPSHMRTLTHTYTHSVSHMHARNTATGHITLMAGSA